MGSTLARFLGLGVLSAFFTVPAIHAAEKNEELKIPEGEMSASGAECPDIIKYKIGDHIFGVPRK